VHERIVATVAAQPGGIGSTLGVTLLLIVPALVVLFLYGAGRLLTQWRNCRRP